MAKEQRFRDRATTLEVSIRFEIGPGRSRKEALKSYLEKGHPLVGKYIASLPEPVDDEDRFRIERIQFAGAGAQP